MSESQVFHLPDVGEGLTEAEVVAWHVTVGDHVAVNEILCDVETAKSVVELPSPFAGNVLEIHAAEGETVEVGRPLISIGVETDIVDQPEAGVESSAASSELLATEGDSETGEIPTTSTMGQSVDDLEQPLILVGTAPKESAVRRVHVSPSKDQEAPFQRLRAGAPPNVGEEAPSRLLGATRIPIKGVRKAIAEAMVRSAFTAPHAAMWTSVDVTATMDLYQSLKTDRAWRHLRISPLLLVARSVISAVRRYPEINASWDEHAQEIVLHPGLNLGVAAATPRGLMVPNIKGADSLSLPDLALGMSELIDRARAGKLSPSDMSGGTFTLTNVGTFGVEGATPIINPPEAAILAVGAIQERPWVVDGRVKVRNVVTLSISIDHRLVDGELGASVLRHVADLLNDPARALL